ncbi:MAG: TetR/AcrR family transcriptional regulator [Bacillota bacterium]
MGKKLQQRTKMKQQAILDAAYDLFLKNGVQGTPVATIAKKASVSQVTIYNYFQSKQNVVRRVASRIIEGECQRFESIVYDASLSFSMKMDRILEFLKTRIDAYDMALIKELLSPLDDTLKGVVEWYLNNRINTGLSFWIREGFRENRIDNAYGETDILLHLKLYDFSLLEDKNALKKQLDLVFYGVRGH